ncbi:hypothetical protein C2G38_2167650 [Gigaspora rosea]|uniref:HAT C-terminal dimerisation domain-containing protein n=1 Tax=Gigaspora rosea TaxID=44941 RepID=A0A397VS70_9GLOM|nr:hypothetical protein C2G38_2167650 [Gigaspora rosea]
MEINMAFECAGDIQPILPETRQECKSTLAVSLLTDIIKDMPITGGLKLACKTRWTTYYDCTFSIVKSSKLTTILTPIKKAILSLEYKSTNLIDCYIQLRIMASTLKQLSNNLNLEFKHQRFAIFNKRWKIPPFNMYWNDLDDVLNWWLKKLAIKILNLKPHNASCKRIHSILKWFSENRRVNNEFLLDEIDYLNEADEVFTDILPENQLEIDNVIN